MQQQPVSDEPITATGVDSADGDLAAAVEQRAAELTGSEVPAGDRTPPPDDPITRAEEHLESLDMDEQRKAVERLTKQL